MDAHCPQCGELGVDCDGQSVCQGCGFVLSDESYVPETGAEGQQIGQHISANGRVPGGSGRNGYYAGLISGVSPQRFPVRAYAEMTILVNRVGCGNQIKQDALHYMEYVYPTLGGQGRMSLERMAAACLYLVVRRHNLPVSLEHISTPAGKFITGADCRKVSEVADLEMPPVNYDAHIQRNMARLPALYNSRKKAAVLDTYDKLQEWSYVSENLTLGNTTGANAAMLLLAAKAHQIKLTPRAVAPVFDGCTQTTVSVNARRIKVALAEGAKALPWLKGVTVKNVIQHMHGALATSPPRKKVAPGVLALSADHNRPTATTAGTMIAGSVDRSVGAPESSQCSEQTDCGGVQQVISTSQKRQRLEESQIVVYDATGSQDEPHVAHSTKHARFDPGHVDSASVDAAIPDHELDKYLYSEDGMLLREQAWHASHSE